MTTGEREHRRSVRRWYATNHEQQRWSEAERGLCPAERELFERHLTTAGRVLNVGCGGGREAQALAALGHRVVALDLLPGFAAAARCKAEQAGIEIQVLAADALHLPLHQADFDYAVMVGQLIDHIHGRARRVECLSGIRRLLRRDGLLIVSTNNIEARLRYRAYFRLVNAFRRIRNPEGLEPDDARVFHVDGRLALFGPRERRPLFHWYRPAEFERDLNAAGFALLELLPYRRTAGASRAAGSTETFYVARAGA